MESHYHTIMLPFRPRLHPCNIPNIRNTPVQIQNTPPSGITLPYHNAKYLIIKYQKYNSPNITYLIIKYQIQLSKYQKYLITKYQIKQSIIPEVPAKSHYQQSKNLIGIILDFLKNLNVFIFCICDIFLLQRCCLCEFFFLVYIRKQKRIEMSRTSLRVGTL